MGMIWEPLADVLPLPLVVGMGVLVLELCGLVLVEVEMTDVGVGTKVLIGVKGGEGGEYVDGQVPVDGSYTIIGADAGLEGPYPNPKMTTDPIATAI